MSSFVGWVAGSFGSDAERVNQCMAEAVAAPPSRPSAREPAFTAEAAAGAAPSASSSQRARAPSQHGMTVRSASEVMSLEPWELALEVWLSFPGHQGYSMEEALFVERLPEVARRVPKAPEGGGATMEVSDLFETPGGGQSLFMALLRPQRGLVHFLYFWKAFGSAVHLAGAVTTEGLAAELEILRDRLLRRLEELALVPPGGGGASSSGDGGGGSASSSGDGGGGHPLPVSALLEEVQHAGSMSASPLFWQEVVSRHLPSELGMKELTIEEVTSFLLAWLHDVQMFRNQEEQAQERQQVLPRSASSVDDVTRLEVFVHIYDVSQEESIQKLNRVLAHRSSPLKFGGVFHAGVEVNGLEWSYGYSERESRPGVSCMEPKQHPQHTYRQTVRLKNTKLPPERIAEILSSLIEEYPGPDYNLLRRNCCHFADDFCIRLGVGGIPSWIHRLARLGAGIETMLQNAPRPIKERFLG